MTTDDRKPEPYCEVREYIYTENVYFDGNGDLLGSSRNYDDAWRDTRETRPLTDDEKEDWCHDR